MQESEWYNYNVVINCIIFTCMPADLFFQSHFLFSHLPIVHADSVLEGVNVLQTFLCVSQYFHRLPHLKREDQFNFTSLS